MELTVDDPAPRVARIGDNWIVVDEPRTLKGRFALRFLGSRAFAMHSQRRWRHRAESSRAALALDPRLIASQQTISKFKNVHRGETCVIIGNGPSLAKTDVTLLRNVVTFGLNRVYLAFHEWGFDTTYHVVVNKYVAEQSSEDFAKIRSPLFTTVSNAMSLGSLDRKPYLLYNDQQKGFFGDVQAGIWEGATVTYVAMQLAYFMGFTRVVLVGVDHRFSSKGEPHSLVESNGPDLNHFDSAYFGPGYKWQLPDLSTSELAYILARTAYEQSNRVIVDATVDGALQVFKKATLEAALSGSSEQR